MASFSDAFGAAVTLNLVIAVVATALVCALPRAAAPAVTGQNPGRTGASANRGSKR